jgi:predicted esterase
MTQQLEPYSLPARTERKAICVILHGLGDSHIGMAGLAMELQLDPVEYILPDAPDSYFGMGYSWYTIPEEFFNPARRMDRKELVESSRPEVERSCRLVHGLLDTLRAQAPETPLILGGFSQGGLIALDAGFSWSHPLMAVFALSSYFPQADEVLPHASQGPDMPVFLGHGEADEVVAFEYGRETADALARRQPDLAFHAYPGLGHAVNAAELSDLSRFIERLLP